MNRSSKFAGRRPQTSSFFRLFPVLFCSLFAWVSCGSTPPPSQGAPLTEVPIAPRPPDQPEAPTPPPPAPAGGGGIVDEIRSHTERGTPSSILHALEIIRSRNLGGSEFGRVMNFVNVTLLRTLYPSVEAQLPPLDPPLVHIYSRILRDAETGVYLSPRPNTTDYLELILPFLAYYPGRNRNPDGSRQSTAGSPAPPERFLAALPDLQRAVTLNEGSVLAHYFIGVVYEQTSRLEDALRRYSGIWERVPEFFPAALGMARIMDIQGRRQEVVQLLSNLTSQFPNNLQIMRQLALAYYHLGDWARAESAVAGILQRNNRDAEFVLMRAHILVEQRQFLRAQAPLDIFATINPNNALFLFLRARVQAEGFNNRDAALNYLRTILRSNPTPANRDVHEQASIYAARLFMESPRPADQNEGRELLVRLLASPSPSLDVISLALDDAIRREAWGEARTFVNRLLNERRSFHDLHAAHTLERAQGNNAAALAFARELHSLDPANEEGIITYISALIDTGRRDEASRMIESRLSVVPSGSLRSRYFFLRSRVRGSEALMMNDLRSSLFEDPRNLDSIIAMFEIHHRRRDERRAVYYLRQGLALAPDNPRLRRYAAEYASALGTGF